MSSLTAFTGRAVKTTRHSTVHITGAKPGPTPARSTPRKVGKAAGVTSPAVSVTAPADGSRRKVYVLVSLVGVMTLTSALLLAVRRDPLVPDTSFSLMAADSTDGVFETK